MKSRIYIILILALLMLGAVTQAWADTIGTAHLREEAFQILSP